MSNALAIASVTAVLKAVLDNMLTNNSLSNVVSTPPEVTVLPPSRMKVGNDELPQLNLFLYHVVPNAAWRNVKLPSRGGRGERLTNAPLALDLYYILTGYGKQPFEAEVLLGYAMQTLHEVPVLTRNLIAGAMSQIGSGSLPQGMKDALVSSGLAEQVELVKITPRPLTTDEISKLWDAMESGYRPSVTYHVSVVLIESSAPEKSSLPALTIGFQDRGINALPEMRPPLPILTDILPPSSHTSALLGDTIVIKGYNLGGSDVRFRFFNRLLEDTIEIGPIDAGSSEEMRVRVPDGLTASSAWVSGLYSVHAVFGTGNDERPTNERPLQIAPIIQGQAAVRDADGNVTVRLTPNPRARDGQNVSLLINGLEIIGEHEGTAGVMAFMAGNIPPGSYSIRLRIDGADSHLIDMSKSPPVFDPTQTVSIP